MNQPCSEVPRFSRLEKDQAVTQIILDGHGKQLDKLNDSIEKMADVLSRIANQNGFLRTLITSGMQAVATFAAVVVAVTTLVKMTHG